MTVKSADKKPEMYIDPNGRRRVRMVPHDKEIVKTEGGMKRIATSQSNKSDRMSGKGLDTFKPKPKKVDEYGGPPISRAKYLKQKPMGEKTLTSAEMKKRNEVAKSIKRDNPDMPMDKKMAIATSVAKKAVESFKQHLEKAGSCPDGQYYCQRTLTCKPIPKGMKKNADGFLVKESAINMRGGKLINKIKNSGVVKTGSMSKEAKAYKVGQTVKPTRGPHAGHDHEVIHVHGDGSYNIKPKNMQASRIRYRLGAAKAKHSDLKEISQNKLSDYMSKSAADVSKAGMSDYKRQDKRISGQKRADDKIRAKQGKSDAAHIKVPASEAKVDELSLSMKDITKSGINPVVTKDKEKIKKDLAAMKPKEATIPAGKTAMTKSDKPDLSVDDKIKLQKIMKMIGKR